MLMLVLLAVMLAKPERWIAAHAAPREPRLLVEVPLFFAIGVYGGFIQVSVGLFLLAGLVLGAGYNLLGANALKNLIVLVFTAAALVVFVVNGAEFVRWAVPWSSPSSPRSPCSPASARDYDARRETVD